MKIWELETPALIVDTAVMERNLSRLGAYCAGHGLKLRPHTKTHKTPELAKLQLRHGATGITVAKVGEAEVMAAAGLDDILIVYPLVGRAKWDRVAVLAQRTRVTVAVDSFEAAEGLASAVRDGGACVGLMLEFNTGFGRCGLPIEESSLGVLDRIRALPGLEWRGILVYPGHIMGTASGRERMLEAENETLRRLFALLDAARIECPVVSGGNTPAAYLSHRFHRVTEIRPGTYIFNDKNTVCAEAATWDDCALAVLATVVSTSVAGKAIIDAGSKTLSGDGLLTGDRQGYGHVIEDPAIVIEDLSEEHGHLDVRRARRRLRVGDRLRIVPNHVCPCVNLHDTLYGVEAEDVVVEWTVAGRGKVQ
jgi:D-serine deaminase-like pyridoxal phosphate-dependent protein